MPGGTRGKPRWVGERLVERLAVLEQRGKASCPILLRRSPSLARKLIRKAVEPPRKLQRNGRRQRRVMLHPRERKDGRRGDPPADFIARLATMSGRASRSNNCAGAGTLASAACWPSRRLSRSGASRAFSVCTAPTSVAFSGIEHRAASGRDDLDIGLPVGVAAEAARKQRAAAAPARSVPRA